MKAHFYLAQALVEQRHVGEALIEAQTAYAMCLENPHDTSSDIISQFILKAKQVKWQAKETARLRELNETLALVEDMLDAQLERDIDAVRERLENREIGETGYREEVQELQQEAEVRRGNIRLGFQNSRQPETIERVCLLSVTLLPLSLILCHRWFRTG